MRIRDAALSVAMTLGAVVAGCDSSTQPSLTPSPPASATPSQAEAPTATPEQSCVGLSQDVGFPVRLGRIGTKPCVIWDETPGGGPYRILVEAGKFEPAATPANAVTLTAVASPYVIPDGVMPPFRADQPCLSGDDARFMVSVFASNGSRLGAELWSSCSRTTILADGCVGPVPGNGANIGRNDNGRVCITWADTQNDETGFRIKLHYASGEAFEYTAPPNTNEFLPPLADTTGLGAFDLSTGRKDYGVQIWAIRPDGATPVGATFVQVQ